MTVTVQTPLTEYTAAPGATVFATSFRLITALDLQVQKNNVIITGGFTVTGTGQSATATVTFTTPMVGGENIKLRRVVALARENNYQFEGDFQANVVNEDFDRLWMSQQEQELQINENEAAAALTNLRNLRAPIGEVLSEMPNAAARANKIQAFDSTGLNPIYVLPGTGTASDVLIDLANKTNPTLGAGLIGHLPSGTASIGTTGREVLNRTRNILDKLSATAKADYLAGVIGVDITAAIGLCAVDLSVHGGTIICPAGLGNISAKVTLGNGTNATTSTRQCVRLQGAGVAPGFGVSGGTQFTWTGTAGGTMMEIAGSGEGFGIDGIEFNGSGTASKILNIFSVRNSDFKNLALREFTQTGLDLDCRSGPSGSTYWSSNNMFSNIQVTSTIGGARGMQIHGHFAGNSDWFRNTFIGCIFQIAKSANSLTPSFGAYYRFCDSNTFIECDFSTYGAGFGFSEMYDCVGHNQYPQNQFHYGCSSKNIAVFESGGDTISDNIYYGFATKDGEAPTVHPKLHYYLDTGNSRNAGVDGSHVIRGTLADVAATEYKPATADRSYIIRSNANDSVDSGIEIVRKVAGVETVYFKIGSDGNTQVFFPGVGLRALIAGAADSAGSGARVVRIAN